MHTSCIQKYLINEKKIFFYNYNGSKNVYMKEITLFQQVYLYILKYLFIYYY
jgi:hypothetical protein